MRVWQEGNRVRTIATPEGGVIAYEGEWVLVVAGASLKECIEQFCPMLRLNGSFEPEPTK